MKIGDHMTVRKLNIAGETELTWTGKLREHTADWLQIEAHFVLYPYIDLGYAVFERGDRFVEWFFTKNCKNYVLYRLLYRIFITNCYHIIRHRMTFEG